MPKLHHPTFKAVATKIVNTEHVSEDQADAMLAASTRKASKAAKLRNPHLKRVRG
jgi:hypothetical protein